ncbi:hypothetical protein SPBR_05408 [Sporothrix brasiliensis 5110]|uniref:Uncharacterized protein n=1 Tax=Sporothrix brasiliensis 5110 TaxID=1398154 RepID=A0A0C2F8W8_9PEZI|nr:uncharacterized protein SPBR_05408 [Sporothrix brasiliensis 5110]KIH87523.1 hypothetical protein SPBR_05408 [Sporothrix brasiliensis 5110]
MGPEQERGRVMVDAIRPDDYGDGTAAAPRAAGSDLPCDGLERLAATVPAPGLSLRPQTAGTEKIKDCLSWLRHFVALLISDGVLGTEALVNLDEAPLY